MEYFDKLIERDQAYSITQTAHVLGIKPSKFFAFLRDNKYCYREKKKWYAYGKYLEAGEGLFKLGQFVNLNGYAGVQTLVTAKGQAYFNRLLNK